MMKRPAYSSNQSTIMMLCLLLISFLIACESEENDSNDEINYTGDQMTEAGEQMAEAGEQMDEAGEQMDEAGEQMAEAGEQMTEAGEQMAEAGEQMTEAGEEINEAGEQMTEAGEQVIIETPDEGGEMWEDPADFGEPGEGIHAFTMTDINGEMVDMRRYRGRVVLVVNVASRCGYTDQYEDLQSLYSDYWEQGLVILGFPANNFGGQEPGSDEDIAEFCSANYGVTFPMFSKISVKGADIHPLYDYLVEASGQEVSWNFNKFLVGKDGMLIEHYQSGVTPYSDPLIAALEAALSVE